jgi:predicted amidohydrolase YtcJ
MKNSPFRPDILLPLLLLFFPVWVWAQSADIVLVHGKIFTSDTAQLYVQALAINGNKIMATGSDEAMEKLAGPATKKIDLQRRTVVPGFNDAHDHLGWLSPVGAGVRYADMAFAGPEKAAILDTIAKYAKTANPKEWISGWVGTTVLFDPTVRAALDSIAPNNPVVLQIFWGHGEVVNKKALEAAGLSDADKDPIGGWYRRDPTGEKIVAVLENAQAPIWNAWFGSDEAVQVKGLRSFAQEQLEVGITTVQQMSSCFNAEESFRFFHLADLPQRIRIIAWPHSNRGGGRQMAEWSKDGRHPVRLTRFSGVKYVIDGTPLERNSMNKKPYDSASNWYGRLDYPVDTIRQILKEALHSDRQLMMHIVGDSSMAIVLSLMKQMASGAEWRKKRVRFEHNSTANITPSEIEEARDLGVLMMHTPKYGYSSPIRSLMKKGITVGISPDGTTNPFWDIMVITSRQANPAEKITREQAVIAFTRTNAYSEFAEGEKGILRKGMLADLAVLSQDIFSVSNEQLPATKSILTMVDGKIVYQQ